MTVLVALENRFYRGADGNIYSNNIFDYSVWKKYLTVFDRVVIFARLGRGDSLFNGRSPANGPGVEFLELPMYVGVAQFLQNYRALKLLAKKATASADAFVIRSPGLVGSVLWRELAKKGIPYGVEVVGNSRDSIESSVGNPLVRWCLKAFVGVTKVQEKQCAGSIAAAYVTKSHLQSLFPPGGWSTHYSSIDLQEEHFSTVVELESKMGSVKDAFSARRPFRICHVGTMDARYKAQDHLMQAVAVCRELGMELEVRLIGDGRYRSYFESFAQDLGLSDHVKFLGKLGPGDPVRREMVFADLFVLPSLTEGLPRVVLESMALGTPCIGSNVGGVPEVIKDELRFSPGDIEEISKVLQSILSDHSTYRDTAFQCIEIAKDYSFEILMARRQAFFQRLGNE